VLREPSCWWCFLPVPFCGFSIRAGASGWGGEDLSTHFRVLMWEDWIRLVREHPWFGVGMETVRLHYREWNIQGFIQYDMLSHFHSTFVQIAVERGVPALLAWLWFSVAYLLFLWRLIRRLQDRVNWHAGLQSESWRHSWHSPSLRSFTTTWAKSRWR
jgi:O-antigen ligase